MEDSELTPSAGKTQSVARERVIVSVILAVVCGGVFAWLPYIVHIAIWSRLAPTEIIFEKDAYPTGISFLAAMSFGAAGLCADPLLELLSVGRVEYSRRYGPPKGDLNYPWKTKQVSVLLFWIAPVVLILIIYYMFSGYEVSNTDIVFRNGPLSSYQRAHWSDVNSIDAACFLNRNGFKEEFSIVINNDRINLQNIVFYQDGNIVTSKALKIAHLVSYYHITQINTAISDGCNSPDIQAVLRASRTSQ